MIVSWVRVAVTPSMLGIVELRFVRVKVEAGLVVMLTMMSHDEKDPATMCP